MRWSRLGAFNKIFAELARKAGKPDRLTIDAIHLKAHRTAASLPKKGRFPDVLGAQRRPDLETARRMRWPGRPLIMLFSEGQMSDDKVAALMLDALQQAKAMPGDKGHAADWLRAALSKRGIVPASPQKPTALRQSPGTARSIVSATKSKICSAGSRTGAASTPAMTDARTPSSQQSASPPQSSSGSERARALANANARSPCVVTTIDFFPANRA